jgi:polysaccharide pyruvyl transferase WcaK-like protein
MTRILIRAGKSPLTVLSHEQSLSTSRLGVFGSNSGNMLFYSAVFRFMAQQHFAFGTRIHGNVAGVLAGTPSVVLANDSRTVELSEYHGIPYRLYSELPPDEGHEGDLERRAYEFEPPFREPRGQRTLEERVTELEKELKVQQESLASWRGRMGRVLRINPLSTGGRR